MLGDGAFIELVPGFVAEDAELLARLTETLPLAVETIRIFGRDVATPRLTSWHGDPGCSYAYSGRRFEPHPWTTELRVLRERLRAHTGIDFNSVLANHYRDGSDSMGAHADNEAELGPTRDDIRVASISLGARRAFVLRPRRAGVTRRAMLGQGDLLLMGGTTQRHYVHEVPKTRQPIGPRLNLTFRVIRRSWPTG
jgi:alkylated DNA repair dioxygenase AlkB